MRSNCLFARHWLILHVFSFSPHVSSRGCNGCKCQCQKCQLAVGVEGEEILPYEHKMPNQSELGQHYSKLKGKTRDDFSQTEFLKLCSLCYSYAD